MHSPARQKELGAYYTDPRAVRFLLSWGVTADTRRVMDPSCGDGRFLHAAQEMGVREVVGCDLDAAALALARAGDRANPTGGRHSQETGQFLEADFFTVDPTDLAPVDLVVGNPPFIRYQRFKGETRRRALESAAVQGATLTGLASSWAPFVLHATRFLRPGGRLAMVVPAEIGNTQYGRPTLRALAEHFDGVRLVAVEQNWFADAQTEAHLLLAWGYREHTWRTDGIDRDTVQVASVASLDALSRQQPIGRSIDLDQDTPLSVAHLTEEEERTFRRWLAHPAVRRLGELGRVGNGYVTGDNSFFHCTRAEARERGWPERWLRPAARSARSLRGLFFGAEDVAAQEASGRGHHLILPEAGDPALPSFLEEATRRGVPLRYKCRVRDPWWRVPGVETADVLLPYMSGDHPHAAVNACGAVHTNSLHGLFVAPGVDPASVAAACLSSFTLLAWELFGRSYGGGVLKLEPTEMARLPVMLTEGLADPELTADVHQRLQRSQFRETVAIVDRRLVEEVAGLVPADRAALQQARERLRDRRHRRFRRH